MSIALLEAALWRRDAAAVVVTVIEVAGSAPREAGARMLVAGSDAQGSIGGGALELAATAVARGLVAQAAAGRLGAWHREVRQYPLGPELAQCCGGQVTLAFEVLGEAERAAIDASGPAVIPRPRLVPHRRDGDTCPDATGLRAVAGDGVLARPLAAGAAVLAAVSRRARIAAPLPVARAMRAMLSGQTPRTLLRIDCAGEGWLIESCGRRATPLYLYGAGHVGQALVHVLTGLDFDVRWVDVAAGRFRQPVPGHARAIVAADPAQVAALAPGGAMHLVMTFSHALDEAICATLLRRNDHAFLGLIGSQTKRARFLQRFRRAGIAQAALGRLTCPIGLAGVPGKSPAAIAVAAAGQLLRVREEMAAAAGRSAGGSAGVHAAGGIDSARSRRHPRDAP
jgi:xanthine dehydrogenase accessory factor